MKTDDFDYYLPEELIRQSPLLDRVKSRLMVLDRHTGETTDKEFLDIIDYLESGDTLVLNNTKVLAARLLGIKEDTHANIELMILKNISGDIFECLVKPLRRVKIGTIISFGDGLLKSEVVEILNDGIILVKMIYQGIFYEILDALGEMPLPPYIKEKLADKDRYQTVYAKELGSAAAPTAGLHFTEELLNQIKEKGVNVAYLTLHVGLGTFRPVQVDDVTNHKMHEEEYFLDEENAKIIQNNKKRLIAVGTTTTRTLETIVRKHGGFVECSGNTDIFIYPGFEFKAIDGMITNFHLPKSTLIMLISAFSSKEYVLNAYQQAVERKYSFFSFGDAMFIK